MNLPIPLDQARALVRFADRHGRFWRTQLRSLWCSGRTLTTDDEFLLRKMRNSIGESAFNRLQIKDVRREVELVDLRTETAKELVPKVIAELKAQGLLKDHAAGSTLTGLFTAGETYQRDDPKPTFTSGINVTYHGLGGAQCWFNQIEVHGANCAEVMERRDKLLSILQGK